MAATSRSTAHPDSAKLAAHGLGLADLVTALQRSNVQAGAGFVQRAGEGLVVRADGLALTTDDLAQAPVATRNGVVVRVADVADVDPRRAAAASRNGAKPCWAPR